MKIADSITNQSREYPYPAPNLEVTVRLPGPNTSAAVIKPGPIFLKNLAFLLKNDTILD
jgi:hypothetical protein